MKRYTHEIYLPTTSYYPLVTRLLEALSPIGTVDAEDIKIALGENAGIWPDYVRDECPEEILLAA